MCKVKDELFLFKVYFENCDGGDSDGEEDFMSFKYVWYVENVKKFMYGDLELVYVSFDILYVVDWSVKIYKLREWYEFLKEYVCEVLVMCGNICVRIFFVMFDCVFLRVGLMKEDIERALLEVMDNGEEGLVIKDFDGLWILGDCSNNWMKIKLDYLLSEDLDVVFIGGYYGVGELRGGKIL